MGGVSSHEACQKQQLLLLLLHGTANKPHIICVSSSTISSTLHDATLKQIEITKCIYEIYRNAVNSRGGEGINLRTSISISAQQVSKYPSLSASKTFVSLWVTVCVCVCLLFWSKFIFNIFVARLHAKSDAHPLPWLWASSSSIRKHNKLRIFICLR